MNGWMNEWVDEWMRFLKIIYKYRFYRNSSHSIIQSYLSYILLDNKFSPNSACSGSKGPPFRFKRTTIPFQKDHHSVSKGPPFRFKRTTIPFQKDHRSVSKGPPFRLKRITVPFEKDHHSV